MKFFPHYLEIPTAETAWDFYFNESAYLDNVTIPKSKSSQNYYKIAEDSQLEGSKKKSENLSKKKRSRSSLSDILRDRTY
ncbi:hypothetical protein [[Phormidium ambiguum] IAM M-71]|uniref:hypothetical protein n=1 Tax=[Phormidium ambiguum] IAM M-71 TaxID=454136 RepID=UPI0011614E6B|nr:hypothetical protein [Phormidium ambiguum]